MKTADVVILGGGIWGLSTAYHLARRAPELKVVVIERNQELACETTSQSAGQVGQLRGDPLLANAVGYTLELLGSFQQLTGHDPHFVRSGSLHLALVPERADMFRQLLAAAGSLGIACDVVDRDAMSQLAPNFRYDDVEAGLYVPNDGYVDARPYALALAAAAREANVEFRLGEGVQTLRRSVTSTVITTNRGALETPRLIITGGPWTGYLAGLFSAVPPMHPIRLQQARTVPCGIAPHHPVVRIPDESCYLRPESDGFLFGFFDPNPLPFDVIAQPEFTTSDLGPEEALVEQSRRRVSPVLPMLADLEIAQYRQGLITCTPDGKFVIGPIDSAGSGVAPVWVATGCGGTGIAGSGAVGRWLANWVVDGEPGDDLTPYAADRFASQAGNRDWLRTQAQQTSSRYYRLPSQNDR